MAMYIRVSLFLLMACTMTGMRPVAGKQPDQARVVKLPVSSMARMAIGFESRRPWNPYWKIRDLSHHALVAKYVRIREKTPSERHGSTEFEIVAVHRTKDMAWSKGIIVTFPWQIKGQPGDLFGLYTSTHQGDAWLVPEKLDEGVLVSFYVKLNPTMRP